MVLPSLSQLGLEEELNDNIYDNHLEEYFEICESDEIEYYNHWVTTGWVGMVNLDLVLSYAIEKNASDIHLTSNQVISYTVLGDIQKQEQFAIPTTEVLEDIVNGILSHQAIGQYVKDLEYDTSYQIRFGPYKDRRFRVSVGRSFDSNFLVLRTIPDKIPTKEELSIEPEIESWFKNSSGAVLVCGATGSGKALHNNEIVVTDKGINKVSEVSIGDSLYDKDGNITRVIDIHEAESFDSFYRIIFNNGEEIKATGRHDWLVLDDKGIWRKVNTDFMYKNSEYTYKIPKLSSSLYLYKNLTENERMQELTNWLTKYTYKQDEKRYYLKGKEINKVIECASSLGYYTDKINEEKCVIYKYKTEYTLKVVYIEKIEDDYKEYKCFEVDNPTHSYLVGRSFYSTHNSTTMSSILRDIQLNEQKKIITIEKPVEAVYPRDGLGLVVQRAIPEDCLSFENGLTSALRQNPDYILIGEVRNQLEVNEFLRAAETGHLAMSTIHTVNTVTTLNRIRSLFTGDEQKRILATLGDVLRGIVNQTLVKSKDGKKRFAVREILTIDYNIRKLIAEDNFSEIRRLQEENKETMEHKLVYCYLTDKCTLEEARSKAPDQIYFDEILSSIQN